MAALLLAVSEPDLPNPVTQTQWPAGATGRQSLQQSIIYLSLSFYIMFIALLYMTNVSTTLRHFNKEYT